MNDIERCYEELRRVIDGGSESMTHADALATVRHWAAQPDYTEVMQQALDALEYINTNCFILADHEGPLERAIPALRKALAAGALDRLAQANLELNLGENE